MMGSLMEFSCPVNSNVKWKEVSSSEAADISMWTRFGDKQCSGLDPTVLLIKKACRKAQINKEGPVV